MIKTAGLCLISVRNVVSLQTVLLRSSGAERTGCTWGNYRAEQRIAREI